MNARNKNIYHIITNELLNIVNKNPLSKINIFKYYIEEITF